MSTPPFAVSEPATHYAGVSYNAAGLLPVTSPPVSPSTAFHGGVANRKRTLSRSDDSGGDGEDGCEARKKPPGVKRACNECRQQKVQLGPIAHYAL